MRLRAFSIQMSCRAALIRFKLRQSEGAFGMYRVFAAGMLAVLLASSAYSSGLDDFNQGVDAHNRGDNSAAIDAMSRALSSADLANNLRPAALIGRGIAYERGKRYADAIADFTAAVALNPERYDAIYERMRAYAHNDEGQLARADCEALTKIRPKFAELYEECGTIDWENGDFAEAVPNFETAVTLGSTSPVLTDLWLEISRLRAGVPDQTEFAAFTKKLGLDGWPQPIFDLYLGKTTPDAVLEAAEKGEQPSSVPVYFHIEGDPPSPYATKSPSLQQRRCLSAFFVGEWQLLKGNIAQAKMLLGKTESYCGDPLLAEKDMSRLAQK